MSQNVPEIRLTVAQEKAANLVAEDKLTNEEIGREIGVNRKTVERWKKDEAFKKRVSEIIEVTRAAIITTGIADRVSRVAAYQDRWKRMQSVIEARAKDMESECAGGESGLLVHTTKQIGGGENAKIIDEYAVDTGLLREMREIEKQAAIEVGDWVEKRDVKTDAKELLAKLLGVPPDALPDGNDVKQG